VCLGIPGKVVAVQPGRQLAVIETFGLKKQIGTLLVGTVHPGDYLMVHAGQAIEILDLGEAAARLQLWEDILADADAD
jgi:hydrogenase expression/formation protein HypC